MNVIFLSPHFPPQFYNFCDRLKGLASTCWASATPPMTPSARTAAAR